MTAFLPFLSRRPVHNDSGLDLHGQAPRQGQGGRLRTLLRPGLDLFCPHLSLSDHLPRPAEEEWVRREGGMRVDLGSYSLFEFGKLKSRICFRNWRRKKKPEDCGSAAGKMGVWCSIANKSHLFIFLILYIEMEMLILHERLNVTDSVGYKKMPL